MRLAILVLLLVAAVFIVRIPAERFEPEKKNLKSIAVASPDDIQKMIEMTQSALTKKLDACAHCIEVSSLNLVGNVYQVSFMFVVTKGFPYGIAVNATIQKDVSKVISLELQSTTTIDQVEKYNEFVSGSEITESSVPSRSELQKLVNNL
jgi:predicted Co/Zn/Cd cation transporter (cation efflux family)